ncbi:penicillin-binding protein activator [Cellvibrio japonicus]|uniref:penicillin-binding protein activator n=1 Tax=Cellvibrio japonicus TaxID=155077 RepID=UPI000318A5F5|nr:penicillin-binding protein activator [Cellvibrio japonicus]
MSKTRPLKGARLLLALSLGLALGLGGCGTSPDKPASTKGSQQPAKLSAKALLEQAGQAVSPERERLILAAAERYIETGKYEQARRLLIDMESDTLNDDAYVKHTDLLANVALQEGSNILAFGILTKPRLEQQWSAMEPAQELSLREKRAQIFDLMGEAERSVSERVLLSSLITHKQSEKANLNSLWHSLMSINLARLEQLAMSAPGDTERGWYALAAIGKNNQLDLDQQQTLLQRWQREWRNHPAQSNLPDDLRLLKSLIASQPRQIALLLPQSGRLAEAGQAVRDGFFAAYYQALAQGRQVPEVRQYDSTGDIIAAYEQAITDGAQLVIGPLDKEKVTELSLLPGFKVPLLTLNYPEPAPAQAVDNLYQFGLALEDEARQVARQAYSEGHRQAMVIIPEQEWSERSARAFSAEWEKLGGIVVNRSQFKTGSNYSRLVKDALLIEQSQQRTTQLQNLLGIKLETTPRSRGDVDMIFLIANPAQARQIKPTFAFHYAGSIPIYATSQVYTGEPNAKVDRDLNGIRFNTMPWLFDTASPEKQAIKQYTQSAAVYDRLQALGADAFRLYARLPQLAQIEQMRLYGATGTLRMLPDGRIEREQIWARFRNGLAQPLPMVVNASEEY